MVYELTHVVKLPLAVVAEHFYEVEGADSVQEFIEIWEDIHYRRGFEADWEVWLHLFREIDHPAVDADDAGIEIPMNEWSVTRLESGIKTATTRTERYGSPGDLFTIDET